MTAETTEAPTGAAEATLVLRKKDFIDRVVARSGAKRGDVRQVAEALLQELGAALAANETLALPPLGKLRVTRTQEREGGDTLVVKIRRAKAETEASEA
ncbi:MAG: HU family DNA-binding protein [Paracoccaceae bacterium]